jgi:hypothetical protein
VKSESKFSNASVVFKLVEKRSNFFGERVDQRVGKVTRLCTGRVERMVMICNRAASV